MLRIFLLLLLASSADAATYVVAKNGADSNPGSEAKPFRTIARGIQQMRAGDSVLVRTGVYREAVLIWDKRGSERAPMRIEAFPGDTPVIDGTGTKAKPGLVTIGNVSWIHIEGFEIRNSPGDGISLRGVRQLTLKNNSVHHSRYGGIRAWGDNADFTIDGNTVHHNVLDNAKRDAKQWSQAIGIEDANRVSITGNWVYKNHGEGIDYIRSDRGLIAGNKVSDNYGANVYLDNAQYTTVDGNLIWCTDDRAFYRDNAPASGIALANERYKTQNPLRYLAITNNIVLRCRSAVYYYDGEARGGIHNTRIANNTFYAFIWAAFVLGSESRGRDAGHSNTVIENNIIVQRKGAAFTARPNKGLTYRNNSWSGGDPATRVNGAGDVNAEPRFVEPGGSDAADYKLRSDSPLRDKGRSSDVKRDFFGTARPRGSALDLGAHEF